MFNPHSCICFCKYTNILVCTFYCKACISSTGDFLCSLIVGFFGEFGKFWKFGIIEDSKRPEFQNTFSI